jgi:hypothetical protein
MLERVVIRSLVTQDEDQYQQGVEKFVSLCGKFLACGGYYVEMQCDSGLVVFNCSYFKLKINKPNCMYINLFSDRPSW